MFLDRLFGKKDSQYDFDSVDVSKLKEKARELEEAQKGMKKKVNPKVLNMIDRCVDGAHNDGGSPDARVAWRKRKRH